MIENRKNAVNLKKNNRIYAEINIHETSHLREGGRGGGLCARGCLSFGAVTAVSAVIKRRPLRATNWKTFSLLRHLWGQNKTGLDSILGLITRPRMYQMRGIDTFGTSPFIYIFVHILVYIYDFNQTSPAYIRVFC